MKWTILGTGTTHGPNYRSLVGLHQPCLGVAKLTRHFVSPQQIPLTLEWIDELSAERYRPMLRLLNGGDVEFCAPNPASRPRWRRKLRIQRCEIFQTYLRHLNHDFTRICM